MDKMRSSLPTPTVQHLPGETGGGAGGEATAGGDAPAKDASRVETVECSARGYLPEARNKGARGWRKRVPRIKVKPADGKAMTQRELDALRMLRSRGNITDDWGRCSLDALVLAYLEEDGADSEYQLALRIGFVNLFFLGARPWLQDVHGCYKDALLGLLDGVVELDSKRHRDLYSAFMHAAYKAL